MSVQLAALILVASFAVVHGAVLMRWRHRIMASRPQDPTEEAITQLTVLIPVRDGVDTLPALLNDLQAQRLDGVHLEVLVIDDHSTDGTVAMVEDRARSWPALRLRRSGTNDEGKKAAIMRGVEVASGDAIALLDADVRCGPEHVVRIAQHFHEVPSDMVLMPVHVSGGEGVLGWLQRREQLVLQAATMGSALSGRPVLANGANLAFRRAAFMEVGGFLNDRRSSGDDMFLLQRMRHAGKRMTYLADPVVVVRTWPEEGWRRAFSQRLRWAGKMWAYRDGPGIIGSLAAVVLPWMLVLATCMVQVPATGAGAWAVPVLLAVAWASWAMPLLRLMAAMEKFFAGNGEERPQRTGGNLADLVAVALFMCHAPLIAILSIFVRPRWKGRRVRV